MLQINNILTKVNNYKQLIKPAIDRTLNSGWLVLGPEVKQFEQSFGQFNSIKNSISVANGTDAIELALKAIGIQHGDSVATVANAGFYTSTALLAIGAEPVYLDVDLEYKVVLFSEIERAINIGVRAIVVTHLYGQAVKEIEEIASICRSAGVFLIEDCAQAHGAVVAGKKVGSFGDIGCFSFYPTKNLGALGDGGAIVTNNQTLSDEVARLRQYGWSSKYQVELPGARNSRLDEMQAAILSVFLPLLDDWNVRRREIATAYSSQITNTNLILPVIGCEDYVAHLYVIRTKQRLSLQTHLRNYDIASDIHYPIPDTRQPVFSGKYNNVCLPNTEQLAEEVLTLPCYPEMTDSDVQQVITAVNSWHP